MKLKNRLSLRWRITLLVGLILALCTFLIMATNNSMQRLQIENYVAIVLLILGGMTATYFVVSHAMRTVRQLNKRIEELDENNLFVRLPETVRKDEVDCLTDSFNDMLERLDIAFKNQKNFVGSAAHELKTPLTIIKTQLQVLKMEESPSTEEYADLMDVTEKNLIRLNDLLDDLLFLTSDEPLALEDVELQPLLEAAWCTLDNDAAAQQIDFKMDCGECVIQGDTSLLYAAFRNLLENAVKYNHPGGNICISVSCHKGSAHLVFQNSGMGIASQELDHIFEPFYRAEESHNHRIPGSGLGLAISQAIFRRHGGDIKVKSIVGKETEFTIELPLKQSFNTPPQNSNLSRRTAFSLTTALKNIKRHWRKSGLYFLVCVIIVLVLQIYMGSIEKSELQLKQLPDAIPVTGTIANANGSQIVGLRIEESVIDGLCQSSYVEHEEFTVLYQGGVGDFPLEEWRTNLVLQVMGINTLGVLDGMAGDAITWQEGYSSQCLEGKEPVCVVDKALMKEKGWNLGDSFPLNLYNYRYEDLSKLYYDPLEVKTYLIVGQADLSTVYFETMPPSVLIPFEAARAAHHRQGVEFFGDSASFRITNLLALNTFKAEMQQLGLYEVIPNAEFVNNKGNTLLLDDSVFISAATRLQESIALLKGFFPLIVVALDAIGYFTAYLLIQNRREEYAILRLLGLHKMGTRRLFMIELALLNLAGGLLGMFLAVAIRAGSLTTGAWVMVLFFLCFTLGSSVALWNLGRTNIMRALSQTD